MGSGLPWVRRSAGHGELQGHGRAFLRNAGGLLSLLPNVTFVVHVLHHDFCVLGLVLSLPARYVDLGGTGKAGF